MRLVSTQVKIHDKTTTSPLPSDYVHELLLQIAAAANAPFPEPTQAVYLETFKDLGREVLNRMKERVLAEWDKPHMLPPISFLLERATRTHFHAEEQWQRVLEIFRHHWHPDIGVYGKLPELDGAAEYALRQIGGLKGFARTELEHESFLRDRFIDAYERYHAEGGEQAHFTQQIAEQTLRQLQRATTGVSELQERVESLEQRFRYDGRLSDELFTPPLYKNKSGVTEKGKGA